MALERSGLPASGRLHDAPRTSREGHLPVLDGLRGVAILLVMIVHLTVMEPGTDVDRAFYWVALLGWTGVDLFFVLSGFLITGILVDAREAPNYFRDFYARRTLRIFPLYYAVVFVSLVVLPALPALAGVFADDEPVEHGWAYWLYLQNFTAAWEGKLRGGILVVAWSLAIEEQFYLVWAPVVYWVRRPTLLKLCVALIAVALVARVALMWAGAIPIVLYVLPFTRMDALALGGLIAILVRQPGGAALLRSHAAWIGLLAAAAVMFAVAVDASPVWTGPVMQTLGFTAIAFAFGALLVVAITSGATHPVPRVLTTRGLMMLGKYSYALYLMHLPVRRVVRDHLFGPEDFPEIAGSSLPGQLLFYPLGAAPAVALAWLSWHLYEKHFLALKRFFPMGHAASPVPAGTAAVRRGWERAGVG